MGCIISRSDIQSPPSPSSAPLLLIAHDADQLDQIDTSAVTIECSEVHFEGTAFEIALKSEFKDLVDFFIVTYGSSGVKPLSGDDDHWDAFLTNLEEYHRLNSNQIVDIVDIAVFGASCNFSALMLAAHQGRRDETLRLLACGASDSVYLQNDSGQSAMSIAIQRRHKEIVIVLIDGTRPHNTKRYFGDDVNSEKHLLFECVSLNHVEIFERLISTGVDISSARSSTGESLLIASIRSRFYRLVELLLAQPFSSTEYLLCDVDHPNPLIEAVRSLDLDLMKILFKFCNTLAIEERKAFVNLQFGDDRMTALHYCVCTEDPINFDRSVDMTEAIQDLIGLGADRNIKNIYGETPLLLCLRPSSICRDNLLDTARLLITVPNASLADNYGKTPVMEAALRKQVVILEELLILNPIEKLGMQDSDGNTALHLVISSSEDMEGVIEFILSNNINCCIKNANGETALLVAAKCANFDYARTIFSFDKSLPQLEPDNKGFNVLMQVAGQGESDLVQEIIDAINNGLIEKDHCNILNMIDIHGYSALYYGLKFYKDQMQYILNETVKRFVGIKLNINIIQLYELLEAFVLDKESFYNLSASYSDYNNKHISIIEKTIENFISLETTDLQECARLLLDAGSVISDEIKNEFQVQLKRIKYEK